MSDESLAVLDVDTQLSSLLTSAGGQRGRPGAGSVPQDDGGDELEAGGEEG